MHHSCVQLGSQTCSEHVRERQLVPDEALKVQVHVAAARNYSQLQPEYTIMGMCCARADVTHPTSGHKLLVGPHRLMTVCIGSAKISQA